MSGHIPLSFLLISVIIQQWGHWPYFDGLLPMVRNGLYKGEWGMILQGLRKFSYSEYCLTKFDKNT